MLDGPRPIQAFLVQHRQTADPRSMRAPPPTSGTWFFWRGSVGTLAATSAAQALHAEQGFDLRFGHANLHFSDHVRRGSPLRTECVFPMPRFYVARQETTFWLAPEIAARLPKEMRTVLHSADPSHRSAVTSSRQVGATLVAPSPKIVERPSTRPGLHGSITPGPHRFTIFGTRGTKSFTGATTILAKPRSSCSGPRGHVCPSTIDPTAAAATREQLLS